MRKYSHIEKEGLAVINLQGEKIPPISMGRPFTVYSDHKPLQYLFSESRLVPSGRIMKWALTLCAYEYQIEYRSVGNQRNAGLELNATHIHIYKSARACYRCVLCHKGPFMGVLNVVQRP